MGTYSTTERTRQYLIEAAGELVAERGIGQVSTRAIAQKAGVNLGTIHYHFGSKKELLREMLRFACQAHAGPSLPDVFKAYENRLDDVQVQAKAVRNVVQYFMQTIFSPGRPRWCSRVLYQVLQHTGTLRDYLIGQMINPSFQVMTSLVRAIRPDWTTEEIYLWIHLTIGPMVYHADHRETVLDRLGVDSFPADYLAALERRLVHDALSALGLPAGMNTNG